MRFFSVLTPVVLAVLGASSPVSSDQESSVAKRAISISVYNDLVHYFKYAASAYSIICPRPNGSAYVTKISNLQSGTQGYIARDDSRKEIVVMFRGSSSPTDFLTDLLILLTPFNSPGVSAPSGTMVHSGFLSAYNSVAREIISTVRSELASHPDYTVVTSGHSLGGALSSLAAISLQQNFPKSKLRMYTYGQPRTGNGAYVDFVHNNIGVNNIFRGVNTLDGVPTLIPTILGYKHHGTEYWTRESPASASNTVQCDAGGEDPACSAQYISGGINLPHTMYYNILALTPYCI